MAYSKNHKRSQRNKSKNRKYFSKLVNNKSRKSKANTRRKTKRKGNTRRNTNSNGNYKSKMKLNSNIKFNNLKGGSNNLTNFKKNDYASYDGDEIVKQNAQEKTYTLHQKAVVKINSVYTDINGRSHASVNAYDKSTDTKFTISVPIDKLIKIETLLSSQLTQPLN